MNQSETSAPRYCGAEPSVGNSLGINPRSTRLAKYSSTALAVDSRPVTRSNPGRLIIASRPLGADQGKPLLNIGRPSRVWTMNCSAAWVSASSAGSGRAPSTAGAPTAANCRSAPANTFGRSIGSVEQAKFTVCPGFSVNRTTPGDHRSSRPLYPRSCSRR